MTEVEFEAAMRLPGATLDNVSDGSGPDWDGDRCTECRTPIPDDSRGLCDGCDEPDGEPHPYPCPTCGGNGCVSCGDTGERIEWTR